MPFWKRSGSMIALRAGAKRHQQLLGGKAALGRRFLQRLAQVPIIEPALAVVVVKREQPPDPDHRAPLGEPKLISNAAVLVAHNEAVEIVEVAKDADRRHAIPPSPAPTAELAV